MEKKDKPESIIDAVGIWSCLTTGYFPSKEVELDWSSFAIFYIILPFAFTWIFLYGITSGIGFEKLFGFFLLDMYGYCAWGLAGVFGAALFTLALQKIIEELFGIEEMGKWKIL